VRRLISGVTCAWCVWIVGGAVTLHSQESRLEQRAILAARQTPVSTLEPGLPKQSLSRWIIETVGSTADIHWELNDCGEFAGNPQVDAGRDLPMCVAVVARLADGRAVTVEVTAGTQKTGLAKRFMLRSVSLAEDKQIHNIRNLSELAQRMRRIK
jgi:hypothetical protein